MDITLSHALSFPQQSSQLAEELTTNEYYVTIQLVETKSSGKCIRNSPFLCLENLGESPKQNLKGSDQRENRRVWSNINTRYLVWGCGDGRSFVL